MFLVEHPTVFIHRNKFSSPECLVMHVLVILVVNLDSRLVNFGKETVLLAFCL